MRYNFAAHENHYKQNINDKCWEGSGENEIPFTAKRECKGVFPALLVEIFP